jgi:hypothetical protein
MEYESIAEERKEYKDLLSSLKEDEGDLESFMKTAEFIKVRRIDLKEKILTLKEEVLLPLGIDKGLLDNRKKFVGLLEKATNGFINQRNADIFSEEIVCSKDTWKEEKGTEHIKSLLEKKKQNDSSWKRLKNNENKGKKIRSLDSLYEEIGKLTWEIKNNRRKLSLSLGELRKFQQIEKLNKEVFSELEKAVKRAKELEVIRQRQTCMIVIPPKR